MKKTKSPRVSYKEMLYHKEDALLEFIKKNDEEQQKKEEE